MKAVRRKHVEISIKLIDCGANVTAVHLVSIQVIDLYHIHVRKQYPDRNCSMIFVRTHACCAQTHAITARFLRAFSRNRAKLRQFAREIRRELQSHFSAGMAKSICTFGKKGSRC